jgi:2,3-dihydroxyphenylpropionate 1,2-dioxygenase
VNTTAPGIASIALSHAPQMAQDVDCRQGVTFRAGLAELAAAVAVYDPTLVVFFGPDHMRALVGIAPCFTVVEAAAGYGDWGSPTEDYDVPHDLALSLGRALVAAGIDIGIAQHLKLDHGFGQSTRDLFGSLSAVPILPIVVNCVDRPLATIARTAELGMAVRDFLASELESDQRVLVIGSGGLSHSPPSLIEGARDLSEAQRQQLITDRIDSAAEAINPAWDREFLERLAGSDWRSLASLSDDDLRPSGTGGAEVRTWIASAFAGGEPLHTVAYEPVPPWITGMAISASRQLFG